MQALPGMTPTQVWDLPFLEWVLIADFTDQWAELQRTAAAQIKRRRR